MIINVRDFGAIGDGKTDDAEAFAKALSQNAETVLVPAGVYILSKTLRLKSNTNIVASPKACIRLAAGAQNSRGDFLLTNDDAKNGNENISVTGGVWDGNSMENDRGDDLFNPKATTGVLFSFMNVKNLSLSSMTVKNPLCYYMRFCKADTVRIENIHFSSEDCHINQDGLHLAGYCSNFVVRNLYGDYGSPGDDFIAINADDCLTRQESFDMLNGPVDNILIENIRAEFCHCFVRLLSVTSRISRITINNISGCCKGNVLNMDAARYCRVPLFDSDDPICENGVGSISDVKISNICAEQNGNGEDVLFDMETNCENILVQNFHSDSKRLAASVRIKNLDSHELKFVCAEENENTDGYLDSRENIEFFSSSFSSLSLRRKNG